MINRNQSPFIRIIIPFVFGILTSLELSYPAPWLYPAFFGMVTAYVLWFFLLARRISYRYRWIHGVMIYLALMLAGCLLTSDRLRSADIAGAGSDTLVVLELREDPVEREKTFRFTARVIALADSAGWRASNGKIMVYLEKSPGIVGLGYGDRLILGATLRSARGPRNPGEFDYRNHLRMRGISSQVYGKKDQWQKIAGQGGHPMIRWSHNTRSLFMNILRNSGLDKRKFALAAAIILGYDEHLDAEQRDQFAGAGAMHVLCVSGLHVGIVALVITRLLFFLGGKRTLRIFRLVLVVAVIWAYAAVTGFSPSVLRAATMFSFMYAGRSFRRTVSIYNMLAASAFLLLMVDPLMIARVGFQLSYLAVTGIVLLYSPINTICVSRYLVIDRVWQLTAVSMAATMATFPLSVFYFNRFPNLFLLTNLVAIPASFLILYNGLALLLFSFSPPISGILAFSFGKVLAILDESITLIDGIPYSATDNIHISGPELFLLFMVIVLLSALLINPHKRFLFLLLITGNLLVLSFSIRKLKLLDQRAMVVYSIPGHTALEFIHGRESVFFGDSILLAQPRKIEYATRGFRLRSGVINSKYVRVKNSYEGPWLVKRGEFIEFSGVRIGMLDLSDKYLPVADPFRLDLLLIRGHSWERMPDVVGMMVFDLLLLDASLAPWVAEDLRGQLTDGRIPFHDVRVEAYYRKLP